MQPPYPTNMNLYKADSTVLKNYRTLPLNFAEAYNEAKNSAFVAKYLPEGFADYFATFIGNGVFVNPADQLKVVAKSGLTVTVKAGKAFIDGYWYILDEDNNYIDIFDERYSKILKKLSLINSL